MVPSPGVPPERYRSRAARVCGDIELGGRASGVPIVAVTGTNGKSTTATLLAERCSARPGCARGRRATSATPALALVGQPLDVAVLEVSSFQLETVERFRPRVAVVLNVTPDHLDRHRTLEAYAEAKARLFARQAEDDAAVLNADDPAYARFRAAARARVLPFSAARAAGATASAIDAGALLVRAPGGPAQRFALDWRLSGRAQPRERRGRGGRCVRARRRPGSR